jgi:hypothetical protein
MNCFRFPDRDTFRALADAEGLLTEDGELIACGHIHAIDEVGIISRGGEWDPETGEVIVPPTIINGWHVNFLGDPPPAWDAFLVVVNHPSRVFLGGATHAPKTAILEAIAQLP